MELNRYALTALMASAFAHFERVVQIQSKTNNVVLPLNPDESKAAYRDNPIIKHFTDMMVACICDDYWGNPEKWKAVYIAANKVMMQVGYEGMIESDHPACDELMGALADIDEGVFDVEKVFGELEVGDD